MYSSPSDPNPLLADPKPYFDKSEISLRATNSTALGVPPESGPSIIPVIIRSCATRKLNVKIQMQKGI